MTTPLPSEEWEKKTREDFQMFITKCQIVSKTVPIELMADWWVTLLISEREKAREEERERITKYIEKIKKEIFYCKEVRISYISTPVITCLDEILSLLKDSNQ